ncbi:hypothetical protein O181_057263 [Austropuccinia psidii MF-1]|uniref:Uncharacterized protein n=1 Tax=Austropuccinia psidii MF-1 TaxID=1389203 RepID=A0A9Q3EB04_9BASI|nr:hypothetical protein [Austropuccinia psidii MF-1]
MERIVEELPHPKPSVTQPSSLKIIAWLMLCLEEPTHLSAQKTVRDDFQRKLDHIHYQVCTLNSNVVWKLSDKALSFLILTARQLLSMVSFPPSPQQHQVRRSIEDKKKAAIELTPAERLIQAKNFAHKYDTTQVTAGIVEFIEYLISSGRITETSGSRWWRGVNGLMILDLCEADEALSCGERLEGLPATVQPWLSLLKCRTKRYELDYCF